MEVKTSDITSMIREHVFPLLKENGFNNVSTTFSHAYVDDDVMHVFQIGRFSNYHRQVMQYPKYTMYARLHTIYPSLLSSEFKQHNTDKKTGLFQLKKDWQFPQVPLSESLEPSEGVSDNERVWSSKQQTRQQFDMLIVDIAHQFKRAFEMKHKKLEDQHLALDTLVKEHGSLRSAQGDKAQILSAAMGKDVTKEESSIRQKEALIMLLAKKLKRTKIYEEYKAIITARTSKNYQLLYGHMDFVSGKEPPKN